MGAESGDGDDSLDPRDFRGQDPADPMAPKQYGLPPSGGDVTSYSPFDIRPDLGGPAPYVAPKPTGYPQGVDQRTVDNAVMVFLKKFQALLGDKTYSRERLQAFIQETLRQQFTPVHLPPWTPGMPIRGFNMADVQAATVGAGATVNIVTLTVPRGMWGFVAWLGQDTQNDTAGAGLADWANLVWSIAVGPSTSQLIPVPGWNNFSFQKGQIEAPCALNIFVPERWVCCLQARNTSGVAIPSVAGRLDGWNWPIAIRMQSLHEGMMVVG